MTRHSDFFSKEVPQMLDELTADRKPDWGTMNASEMLEHLRRAVEMTLENSYGEIATPEEKIPSYQRFLMSDKPFARGLRAPENFFSYQVEPADFEECKERVKKAFAQLMDVLEKTPDFSGIHPSFGKLNADQWRQMHFKHVSHHFEQFGLR